MDTNEPDVLDLDRRAVLASVEVVSRVGDADLGRPTPCEGWTVADLLGHMTAQHHGFAAAAAGGGADPAVWRPRAPGVDLVGEYAAAAGDVLAAFAADGVLDRRFALPEISTRVQIPARQAIGFHFIDYLVHGWDLSRALGLPYEPAPGMAEAALPIARVVPDGPRRLEPDSAFRPGLPAATDATALDQVLATLGRSPSWPD
jgi:uncharacterized protein (TIGR03086 family)